ncbi:MAG: DNA-protecting protein DprA [Defluviitaleaceae bacterium]|nr:DNA-protecting protein DprA [Defluviitaleaceae bacterium]
MKVAVVGSRDLIIKDLSVYMPCGTTEIISGGARGIDTCAREYAVKHGLKLTEFLPEYEKYGREAPLVRDRLIVDAADVVVAIWDGKSRGTMYTVDYAAKVGKDVRVSITESDL